MVVRFHPTLFLYTRYVLTKTPPQDIHDLVLCKGDSDQRLSKQSKQNIVRWANTTIYPSVTYWKYAQDLWLSNNESSTEDDFPVIPSFEEDSLE